jgi:choline dehydrogenase
MRKYFINLENNHVVPPGTLGHGFNSFFEITVNGPQFLQNQSQAYEVMQAAVKVMG